MSSVGIFTLVAYLGVYAFLLQGRRQGAGVQKQRKDPANKKGYPSQTHPHALKRLPPILKLVYALVLRFYGTHVVIILCRAYYIIIDN